MSSVNLLRLQKSTLIRYATGTRIAFRISIFEKFTNFDFSKNFRKFWISKIDPEFQWSTAQFVRYKSVRNRMALEIEQFSQTFSFFKKFWLVFDCEN